MKQRVDSLRKINKINKPYPNYQITWRQRAKVQVNKIRNERGDTATETEDIQRLMTYFINMYPTKLKKSKRNEQFSL